MNRKKAKMNMRRAYSGIISFRFVVAEYYC